MHMIHYVTITSQGQITIPVSLRRKYSFTKASKAILMEEKDQLILKPETDILSLQGIFKTKKKIPFRKVRQAFEEALARGEA